MHIGERIKALRIAKGMSMNALAKVSDVSQGQLSGIEAGKFEHPRADTLSKIATALGVSVSDLTSSPIENPHSLKWFWRARFSTLKGSEILTMREASVADRVRWSLSQLLDAFSHDDVVTRMAMPEEVVRLVATGEYQPANDVVDRLSEGCDVPLDWLLHGNPGPIDSDLRRVLENRDSGIWLSVISLAIDAKLPPELVKRQIEIMMQTAAVNGNPRG